MQDVEIAPAPYAWLAAYGTPTNVTGYLPVVIWTATKQEVVDDSRVKVVRDQRVVERMKVSTAVFGLVPWHKGIMPAHEIPGFLCYVPMAMAEPQLFPNYLAAITGAVCPVPTADPSQPN